MREYLIKRIMVAFVILLIVMTLNFVIFRVVHPVKDPTHFFLIPDMTAEDKEILRRQWGLDQPLFPWEGYPNQFMTYMWNLLSWNYGKAFTTPPTDIAPELAWRLTNSVLILGLALIGAVSIGLPLGILAGSRRGRRSDVTVMGLGLLTWGLPIFFVQILWLLFFSYYITIWLGFPLLPPSGVVSIPPPTDPFALAVDKLWHLIGPVATLVIGGFGGWALYTRNMMIDALTEDYVLTARAKGATERGVLYKHAFRSILPPIATMLAMAVPGIVTGAIITESIFGWPGIGQWYISALNNGNHPVTQAILYNYAVLMILANLLADVIYGFLDPRIRVGMRR